MKQCQKCTRTIPVSDRHVVCWRCRTYVPCPNCGVPKNKTARLCTSCANHDDAPPGHKTCSKCKGVLPLDSFARKGSRLYPWCRDCQAVVWSAWYSEPTNKRQHVEKTRTRSKRVRADNLSSYVAYLLEHPCVDCGEANLARLDPDHVGTKRANVSKLIRTDAPWSTILAELNECEIRCANCHRDKTAQEQGWHKTLGL